MPAQFGIPTWQLHCHGHWNHSRKGPWILYFWIWILSYHWSRLASTHWRNDRKYWPSDFSEDSSCLHYLIPDKRDSDIFSNRVAKIWNKLPSNTDFTSITSFNRFNLTTYCDCWHLLYGFKRVYNCFYFLSYYSDYIFHRAALVALPFSCQPRVGSGVVRMDPLRFLAGCRTRRLNQA